MKDVVELKGKEGLNIDIAYRLEKHSGGLIPAISWWKLLVKKQEYEIKTLGIEYF